MIQKRKLNKGVLGMSLLDAIENKKREIYNTKIDTTDADFLNEFDVNVKSLCEKDFFDLVLQFDMLYNNIGYDEASRKFAKVAYIFKTLFGKKEDYERVLAAMDMIYGVIEDYKDKLKGYSYKDFKRLKDNNIELEALQSLLDILNKSCSVEEINNFLCWPHHRHPPPPGQSRSVPRGRVCPAQEVGHCRSERTDHRGRGPDYFRGLIRTTLRFPRDGDAAA